MYWGYELNGRTIPIGAWEKVLFGMKAERKSRFLSEKKVRVLLEAVTKGGFQGAKVAVLMAGLHGLERIELDASMTGDKWIQVVQRKIEISEPKRLKVGRFSQERVTRDVV